MGVSGLGKILLHEGLIGEKNLKIIEKTCHQAHAGIAKAVLTIGLLDEEELASLLVERTQFKRIPRGFAQSKAGKVDPSAYLALPFIEFLEVFPYGIHNGRLDVVTLDPMDYGVIHQVEFFSGRPVRPHIASLSELVALIRTVLPDFAPEEPNLQDFLIDYSVSSAQTLLNVGPASALPQAPADAFAPAEEGLAALSADDATPEADEASSPAPEGVEHAEGADDGLPDLSGPPVADLALHTDANIEDDKPNDLNQDVMDIFAEDSESEMASDGLSQDEMSRLGISETAAEEQPEAEEQPVEMEATEDVVEAAPEAEIEPEPELAAEPAVDQPEPEPELAAEPEPELDQVLEPLAVEDIPIDEPQEELSAEDASEDDDALIDDITPEDDANVAEDAPLAAQAITPIEGAVRALNEGLIKLSLGIGGDPHEAAVSTWAKIVPEGKIVRIGGEAGDKAEVLNWQADGGYDVNDSGDSPHADVVDLVAKRTESNALAEPEGWQEVQEQDGVVHSTGVVQDDGRTGLYLVAGLEDSYLDDETFSHLSKKFLKLWHQKWAG